MRVIELTPTTWEVREREGKPVKACTFAFDTETLTYFDEHILTEKELAKAVIGLPLEEVRSRTRVEVWAWQCYDEENGFYMSNDFYAFLNECCLRGYKYGWCYNATFDFAQIDYQLLVNPRQPWKLIEKGNGKAYSKKQPWAYESIHSDMGARYAYKLWVPYRNPRSRREVVHSVEIRDFMKFLGGGLRALLEDLDIRDVDGSPLRKLTMDYQAVKPTSASLTADECAYCRNDVAGLYFAVKKFDEIINQRSGGECRIYGKDTNVMTAGGFAKKQLLRSMYPNYETPSDRLKAYQSEHPETAALDKFLRDKHLYRGGISFVNPAYKGKLIINRPMYRYDVNSEYPYSMSEIRDLVGSPWKVSFEKWLSMDAKEKENIEAAYMLTSVTGSVKPGMLGVWYDPFRKDFVDCIDETGEHLIFERELMEMTNWFDLEYSVAYVVLWRRGKRAYRPFVLGNYENKSKAPNKTVKKEAKLEINASYGKLAERLERGRGHYEAAEGGNVHFVHDAPELDEKSRMSVAAGALVTSFARVYILSMIRDICPCPTKDFLYIDTDSIHCFNKWDGCDASRLGALKCEAVCQAVKYIAPKTYVDIIEVRPDGVPFKGMEIHSKGVSVKAVFDSLKELAEERRGKGSLPTLEEVSAAVSYGAKYTCLQALNVRGGKALVPVQKYLCRPEMAPDCFRANMDGNMIVEL